MAPIADGRRAGQLSLDVALHPELEAKRRRGDATYLQAELEVKVAIPVYADLNPGDELMVTIADADGTVLGHARAALMGKGAVSFDTLEDGKLGVIGTLRRHKARQTEA